MRRATGEGFSLLETLLALAVLGVALLLGLDLVLRVPRTLARLDAGRQAVRALESTLEAVRAGEVPLETSRLDGFDVAAGEPAPPGLAVRMTVTPTPTAGLFSVVLEARGPAPGGEVSKRLETLVWRSP